MGFTEEDARKPRIPEVQGNGTPPGEKLCLFGLAKPDKSLFQDFNVLFNRFAGLGALEFQSIHVFFQAKFKKGQFPLPGRYPRQHGVPLPPGC